MNQQQFDEAKRYAEEISKLLSAGNLTAEEQKRLEHIQSGLVGAMLQNWLPLGWARRLAMLAFLLVALAGLVTGNVYLMLAWLLVPAFSPRTAGTAAYGLGRIASLFRGTRQ